MIAIIATVVALAAAYLPEICSDSHHGARDAAAAVQLAQLSDSESFAAYRRVILNDTTMTRPDVSSTASVTSDPAPADRKLRPNPILIGVTR